MQRVKVGVIGAGIMGSNHFRVALRNAQVELVAICDNDLDKLELLAMGSNVELMNDPHAMLGKVDAVIIATPTESHYPLAKLFLENSIPVLLEKPISSTAEEGQELIALAEKNNVVFQVGHVERFNSAVMALPQYVVDPLLFEFRRISPFSGRVRESIVTDLMIHDLELLCFLNPYPISGIQAIGQNPHTEWSDFASVLISFENGSSAMLIASRIGQQKVRTIEITKMDSVVHADLLRQDIVISRVDHVEYSTEGGARFKQHGMMELPFIDRFGEPLMLEQQEFVEAVQNKRETSVNPKTAMQALILAHEIEVVIASNRTASYV